MKNEILIDLLDPPIVVGLENVEIMTNIGKGNAKLTLLDDKLYFDDREVKVGKYPFSSIDEDSTITGLDVIQYVRDQGNELYWQLLNYKILETLIANPELFPENLKQDFKGNPIWIALLGTTYLNPADDNKECVSFMGWFENNLVQCHIVLEDKWQPELLFAYVE